MVSKWNYIYSDYSTALDTLQTINGCDSVIQLFLTINTSYSLLDSITSCDTLAWHGQTIDTSGVYSDSLTTVSGCDSVHTLVAIINYTSFGDTTSVAECNGTINGATYDTNVPSQSCTLTNVNGCDSILTLDAVIVPSYLL